MPFDTDPADDSYERDLMLDQIDNLQRQVRDWEEREAGCCPEDVGFEELIGVLRSRLDLAMGFIDDLAGLDQDTLVSISEDVHNKRIASWARKVRTTIATTAGPSVPMRDL